MNIALVIGKKNSTGVPGKNIRKLIGRPAAEYSFIATKYVNIEKVYVSTDCDHIASIGLQYGAKHISRPDHLATPEALTEDALIHAYENIILDLNKNNLDRSDIDSITLLFCNNPAIDVNLLRTALLEINKNKELDSVVSVAKYDMFSPTRARKIINNNLVNFVDLNLFDNVSSIRGSQGSVYFCDLSIQVLNKRCFEEMEKGSLPFKWHGNNIKPIETDFGFDIDSEWQSVVIEYWLKQKGFTENKIPW